MCEIQKGKEGIYRKTHFISGLDYANTTSSHETGHQPLDISKGYLI
jgi:hypothetical protein